MECLVISLATFERVFVMLGTTFFSVMPNLLALGSAASVVELIRNHDPTSIGLALGFILTSCVVFPPLVVEGRDFIDFCRTRASDGKGAQGPGSIATRMQEG